MKRPKSPLLTRRAAHRVMPLEARLMFDAAAAADASRQTQAATPTPDAAQPAATADTHERGSLAVVDKAGADGTPAPRVALALDQVNALLAGLPKGQDFGRLINDVFGHTGTDPATFSQRLGALSDALAAGGLKLQVELRSGAELQGAFAAYAAHGPDGTERIYLNADWVNRGASQADIARALLEETGHAIDQRLNAGTDTAGDEGERFSALVRGESISDLRSQALYADADQTTLMIDGAQVDVEFAEMSVPFAEGFIGTQGSSSNAANGVINFGTLGIVRASFFQDNGSNAFTAQGNDIPGGLRLTMSNGSVITVTGAINWRVTQGSTLYCFGFIPDPATSPISFSYGNGGTFTISSTSNFGLELVGVNYSTADNSNVNGNAATNGLLTALNGYLATVQANDPNGPVTVNTLTTSDTTPTLSGSATLGNGESLSVLVNGITYTTGNGLSVAGGSWSLTIPDGNALVAGSTYSVTASIINGAGYTLTDSSANELVIQVPDTTAPAVGVGQTFSYAENRSAGAVLGTVAATDAVGVTGYRFTSTGTTTSSDGYYSIATNGQVTLTTAGATAAANDYETLPNSFTHGVQARDAAGNWSTSANVVLNVTDLDDTAPVIASNQNFSYAENRSAGAVLGTVSAMDAVGVTGYRFTSTGTTTSSDGYYSIAANGQVTLTTAGAAAAANDYETLPNSFTHGVQARDAAGNWSGSANVVLDVSDLDDTAPVVAASQSFSYAENRIAGTVLGTVSATDAVGVTGYRFTSTGTTTSADGHYSISANGQITLTAAGAATAANDYETLPNSFTHGVQARDAAGNWSASVNVVLNVADLDDTAPAVAASQTFSYAENRGSGAVLGTVSATDAVGVTGYRFTSTGTTTSSDGFYSIGTNGQISLTSAGATSAANDYETLPNAFTHSIQAVDAAGNWSAPVDVTLAVTDLSESVTDSTPPVVSAGQAFSYAENRIAGAVVGTVVASDAVGVTGYRFAGTGAATSSDGFYSIDANGQITLTSAGAASAANDHETLPNRFTHGIEASDVAGNWSTSVDVVLNVTDLDDTPPIVAAGQTFSYAENRSAGAALGTVSATDAVGVTGYRFTGTGTATSSDGFYSIDTNGQITLTSAGAASAANDYETLPNSFIHAVEACDAAGNWSASVSVTLAVTDVNESVGDSTPPVVGAGQSFDYAENRAAGTVLGTVTASDAVGVTGYRFTGTGTTTSADGFYAIGANGQITLTAAGATAAANDFETLPNVFTLGVQARDAAGNWSAPVDVHLTVTDVNEAVAAPDVLQVAEDSQATGNVLSNDAGGSSRVVSFQVGSTTVTAGGTLEVAGVGSLTVAANGDFVFVPRPDWHGTVPTVRYTTDLGQTSTLDLVVTSVNDTPALSPDQLGTFQDVPWEGRLPVGSDADGDALTYRLVEGPVHGSVTLDSEGRYRYTPDAGFAGTDRFRVAVSDGQGGNAEAWVDVTVMPSPTINLPAPSDRGVSNTDRTTSADVITLAGSGTPGQTLVLYDPSGRQVGTAVVDANGQWAVANINLRATRGDTTGAAAGAPGAYTFTLRASLGDGTLSAPVPLTLHRELVPVATPAAAEPAPAPAPAPEPAVPSVAAPEPVAVQENRAGFDTTLRHESRPDAPLTVMQVQDPGGATVFSLPVRDTSDGDIYTRPSGFQIMVNPAPEPSLKLFRGLDDQTAALGAAVHLQVPADTFVHTHINETVVLHASLADGRPLPRWLQFDGRTGAIEGEVPADWRDDLVIRVVARDSQGREASAMMRLKVGASPVGTAGLSRQLMQGHGAAARAPGRI